MSSKHRDKISMDDKCDLVSTVKYHPGIKYPICPLHWPIVQLHVNILTRPSGRYKFDTGLVGDQNLHPLPHGSVLISRTKYIRIGLGKNSGAPAGLNYRMFASAYLLFTDIAHFVEIVTLFKCHHKPIS